jgi:hypothetical protein
LGPVFHPVPPAHLAGHVEMSFSAFFSIGQSVDPLVGIGKIQGKRLPIWSLCQPKRAILGRFKHFLCKNCLKLVQKSGKPTVMNQIGSG